MEDNGDFNYIHSTVQFPLPGRRTYFKMNNDVRSLIIHAIDLLGKRVVNVAELYNPPRSTVSNIKKAFYGEGQSSKKSRGGNRPNVLQAEQ